MAVSIGERSHLWEHDILTKASKKQGMCTMRRNSKTKEKAIEVSVLTLPLREGLPACRSHWAPLCFRGSSTEGQLNGLQSNLNPAAFLPIASSTGQWPFSGWGSREGGTWQSSPLLLSGTSAQKNKCLLKALADRYFDIFL